jgi:pimeloyl-ACP methyl ester carboxylesterase
MPSTANIYYHVYQGVGEGEIPLVLIHGAGGSYLSWPSNIRRLPGCHIFALDLPGHGKSAGRGYQSIAGYAEVVANWMQAIHLQHAVIMGHSMGSAIAMQIALDSPWLASAIILAGSAAKLRVSPTLLEASVSSNTFHKAVELIIQWSFFQGSSQRLKELARDRMLEVRPSVLNGDLLACNTFDLDARLKEIAQPVLIVCGEADRMVPLRQSQYLARMIPESKLEIIPQAGHMFMLEQPERLEDVLLSFIHNLSF